VNNERVDGKGEARDKDRAINMSGTVFVIDDEGVKLVAKLRSMWIPKVLQQACLDRSFMLGAIRSRAIHYIDSGDEGHESAIIAR